MALKPCTMSVAMCPVKLQALELNSLLDMLAGCGRQAHCRLHQQNSKGVAQAHSAQQAVVDPGSHCVCQVRGAFQEMLQCSKQTLYFPGPLSI